MLTTYGRGVQGVHHRLFMVHASQSVPVAMMRYANGGEARYDAARMMTVIGQYVS